MNEEEVIRDILAGNVNRYEEIVKEYQTIVANLCFKIGGAGIECNHHIQICSCNRAISCQRIWYLRQYTETQ